MNNSGLSGLGGLGGLDSGFNMGGQASGVGSNSGTMTTLNANVGFNIHSES